MSDYSKKLRDPRWQKRRLEIMNRDGFKCMICEDASQELHVHHFRYRGSNPWDAGDDDLGTLCSDCHSMAHMEQKKVAAFSAFTGSQKSTSNPDRVSVLELWLLKLTFNNETHPAWLYRHLDCDWIRNNAVRELVYRTLEKASGGDSVTAEDMIFEAHNDRLVALIVEATKRTLPVPNPLQQLEEVVTRIRNARIDDELERLCLMAGRASIPSEERLSLFQKMQDMRMCKREKLFEIIKDGAAK